MMNGNSDELNRAYLDRLTINCRYIGTEEASTECTLFGRKLATPILLGGLAHYERLHESGMVGYAAAAASTGTAMWTGFSSDAEIESVVAAGIPAARIIKPFADTDCVLSMIAHDEKAGCCAVAMDIDHAYNKRGFHDSFGGKPLASPGVPVLRMYAQSTSLPFFCKGVLSVPDAVACAEAGIAGIVVSQHQNMFPWNPPVLSVLPEIRKAVGSSLTILCDSGLDTGYECFKALALGADGVFTVRPMMPIFRKKGAAGVAERLTQMTDELRCAMSRTGSKDVRHIDSSAIRLI